MHELEALQTTGAPAKQMPLPQLSAPLHKLASAQDVPFGTLGCMQPQAGSQTSRVQGFRSSRHGGGSLLDTHRVDTHVSEPLQTFPSEHGVPLGASILKQPTAGMQVSMVQGLPSSQRSGPPLTQRPPKHCSTPLQRFESAQLVASGTLTRRQPHTGSQASRVHGFPSSAQTMGSPRPVHRPERQVSMPLQGLASEQLVPSSNVLAIQVPVVGLHTLLVQELPSLSDAQVTGVP
jgi:hypothetical protein